MILLCPLKAGCFTIEYAQFFYIAHYVAIQKQAEVLKREKGAVRRHRCYQSCSILLNVATIFLGITATALYIVLYSYLYVPPPVATFEIIPH